MCSHAFKVHHVYLYSSGKTRVQYEIFKLSNTFYVHSLRFKLDAVGHRTNLVDIHGRSRSLSERVKALSSTSVLNETRLARSQLFVEVACGITSYSEEEGCTRYVSEKLREVLAGIVSDVRIVFHAV